MDWDFLEPRNLLVGSPDHVAEKVHELQEICHLEYLLAAYSHTGMPQKRTLRNLALFTTKAMPLFSELPEGPVGESYQS
ncbi:MAG: hypothetical protein CL694_10055 [Chloroflexi bacterium]|nr:hypothetical protein [Chloroflexota bacterium]